MKQENRYFMRHDSVLPGLKQNIKNVLYYLGSIVFKMRLNRSMPEVMEKNTMYLSAQFLKMRHPILGNGWNLII